MKIVRIIASVLPVVVFILVGLQLYVSNSLAGMGKLTQSLDKSIDEIRVENIRLRQAIATHTSLHELEAKAVALGYTHRSTFITLLPADVAYNLTQ